MTDNLSRTARHGNAGDQGFLDHQWARPGLDADTNATLQSVEEGLTVQLIATTREMLKSCSADDNVADAIEHPDVERFDYLPVVTGKSKDASIIGLFHRARIIRDISLHHKTVKNLMDPLSESNLISADAGILSFLRTADTQPCRLLVQGTRIMGLVSLSDIQRLPVRPVLFLLITQLELLMSRIIRQEYGNSTQWIERLSPSRQSKLNEEIDKKGKNNMMIDPILMAQFCDKRDIISENYRLVGSGKFCKELTRVEHLRNDLAHANDYALTPRAAQKTCEVVRLCEYWIETFSKQLPASDAVP